MVGESVTEPLSEEREAEIRRLVTPSAWRVSGAAGGAIRNLLTALDAERALADQLAEALSWICNRYRDENDDEAREIAAEALARWREARK